MSLITECVSYQVATTTLYSHNNESYADREIRFMQAFVDANAHVSDSDIAREIENLAHCVADSDHVDFARSDMSDLERYVELLRHRIDEKFADDDEVDY